MAIKVYGSDGVYEFTVTGATIVPVGTTAQRPTEGAAGMIRYNTTLQYLEWYDPELGAWRPLSESDFTS